MEMATANVGGGDKLLMINDKPVTLKDQGQTGGGRHRFKAQVYVTGIGQIWLTAYAVEKEIGAIPARRGRPPGSVNKSTSANKALTDALQALTARVEQLSRSSDRPEQPATKDPSPAEQIAALQEQIEQLSRK